MAVIEMRSRTTAICYHSWNTLFFCSPSMCTLHTNSGTERRTIADILQTANQFHSVGLCLCANNLTKQNSSILFMHTIRAESVCDHSFVVRLHWLFCCTVRSNEPSLNHTHTPEIHQINRFAALHITPRHQATSCFPTLNAFCFLFSQRSVKTGFILVSLQFLVFILNSSLRLFRIITLNGNEFIVLIHFFDILRLNDDEF